MGSKFPSPDLVWDLCGCSSLCHFHPAISGLVASLPSHPPHRRPLPHPQPAGFAVISTSSPPPRNTFLICLCSPLRFEPSRLCVVFLTLRRGPNTEMVGRLVSDSLEFRTKTGNRKQGNNSSPKKIELFTVFQTSRSILKGSILNRKGLGGGAGRRKNKLSISSRAVRGFACGRFNWSQMGS